MSEPDKNLPCDFEAELPLLLYQGELAREERERLKSHLATCARCSEALAQLEATAIALDGALAVPKPTADQWQKLKADVLARVARPATAADAPPSDEACESIEEDLLVLNEVGAERKKVVLAHLDVCAACRETRSAFGSIGLVLNREPLEWPSIERWDSLKADVMSSVQGEVQRSKESARLAPPSAAPIRRVSFGTMFARAAAAVVLLAGVAGAATLLRGPSAEEVRRLYRDAQGGGTLAVVTRNYELVVQKGIDKPECRSEVDDSLLQLQAIHHYENALSQGSSDQRIVQLRDGMLRYPSAWVTQLALKKYNELMPSSKPVPVPQTERSGFEDPGQPRLRIDKTFIARMTANYETQYVAIQDLKDEASARKKIDLRTALVAGYTQLAQAETEDRAKALENYKKALSYSEPNTPNANDLQKHVEALSR